MKEKENEKKVNPKQLNEVVSLSAKLLKIVYSIKKHYSEHSKI